MKRVLLRLLNGSGIVLAAGMALHSTSTFAVPLTCNPALTSCSGTPMQVGDDVQSGVAWDIDFDPGHSLTAPGTFSLTVDFDLAFQGGVENSLQYFTITDLVLTDSNGDAIPSTNYLPGALTFDYNDGVSPVTASAALTWTVVDAVAIHDFQASCSINTAFFSSGSCDQITLASFVFTADSEPFQVTSPAEVPAPGPLALLAGGLLGIGTVTRRRLRAG